MNEYLIYQRIVKHKYTACAYTQPACGLVTTMVTLLLQPGNTFF